MAFSGQKCVESRGAKVREERGIATFTGTNATVEVPTGIHEILYIALTPAEAVNADETLHPSETINDAGRIDRPASGTITIARTGTKTSGLRFFYRIEGY